MFRQLASLLICVGCLLLVGQCQLSLEKRLQAERECVEETKIDYDIIMKVVNTSQVSDEAEYQQFLNCYWRKQGFIGSNGEIQFDEIKKMLMGIKDGYTSAQADEILDQCKELAASEPSELPVKVLKCVLRNILESEDE